MILLDTSGSLGFGSERRTKFDLLLNLAAIFTLSGFFSKDRVSLALFGSKVDLFIPAAKGWAHAVRLIREMVARAPDGGAKTLDPLWLFLNSVSVPRSLVFLLTDFQAPLAPGNLFSICMRKHELVVVLASDQREWKLPQAGRFIFRDPESGETRVLNTRSRAVRAAYEQRALRRRSEFIALLEKGGADWVEFSTGSEYEPTLRRFLESRNSRMGYPHP